MKRVMIVGQPDAGKSRLARLMGERTGLPVFHIDKEVHWKPGWVERERPEKTELCQAIHAQDRWIFEGGHSVTWPERLERADTLVWLDVPLWLRYRRVMGRTIKDYGKSRPDLPEDCPEQFDPEFFVWIWNTRKRTRRKLVDLFDRAEGLAVRHHLRTNADVDRFLGSLNAR